MMFFLFGKAKRDDLYQHKNSPVFATADSLEEQRFCSCDRYPGPLGSIRSGREEDFSRIMIAALIKYVLVSYIFFTPLSLIGYANLCSFMTELYEGKYRIARGYSQLVR